MTSPNIIFIKKSTTTKNVGVRGNYILLHADQTDQRLENTSGRIMRHHASIIKGLKCIGKKFLKFCAPVLTDRKIIQIKVRITEHRQNLPRGRFDRHDSSFLIFHELFAISLQLHIDRQGKILTLNGLPIERTAQVILYIYSLLIAQYI